MPASFAPGAPGEEGVLQGARAWASVVKLRLHDLRMRGKEVAMMLLDSE